MNRPEEIMPNMKGRKDLGIQRIAKQMDIPKQSQAPTRTGTGIGNINGKMKKVMKSAGMIK